MRIPVPGDIVTAYHGTPVTGVDLRRGSVGFFVTTDFEKAKQYARGGRVVKFRVDTSGYADLTRNKKLFRRLVDIYNSDPDVIEDERQMSYDDPDQATLFSGDGVESELIRMGYRGAIVMEDDNEFSINTFNPPTMLKEKSMPYKLKKVSGGWQVTSPNHPSGFKKTPHKTKKAAQDQLAAIKIHADESISLIGDLLRESELLDKPTPTVEDLASKYKVSVQEVKDALEVGTGVEFEHTKDPKVAEEIALDHLGERLDYYKRLKD